ncbi:hypothetical protein SH449x_004725 [Pirellulaceae bacterium SH449]
MVLDPWLWWVVMIVTVVVHATRDHGFESPVLHEWLPPATPWTYMDSFVRSTMKLIAQHSDGVSTHLLQWTMTAEGGLATVVAYWYEGASRTSKEFQFPFTDAQIAEVANLIRGLDSTYAGTTDDAPDYRLRVIDESEQLLTHVFETFEWDEDLKSDMIRFRRAWNPIAFEIEQRLALPGRS